jgi:hypothetical protein
MAQTSGSGSSYSSYLFWMMVALVCAVGIILGVAFHLSSRLLFSMAPPSGADSLTAHTRTADFRVEKLNDIGPGLPLYPHAVLLLPGTNAGEAMPQKPRVRLQTTTYYTEDIRELVDSWYLQHLGAEFVRHSAGDPQAPGELTDVAVPADSIVFIGKRGDQVRMVTLTSNSSGTTITQVRFTKRQGE